VNKKLVIAPNLAAEALSSAAHHNGLGSGKELLRRTASMEKPILVVTAHFIKPVELRIGSTYEVGRKTDGTLFTRDERAVMLQWGTSSPPI
jgi:hypothetical protein